MVQHVMSIHGKIGLFCQICICSGSDCQLALLSICPKDGIKQLLNDLMAEIKMKEQKQKNELSGDGSSALGEAFFKAFENMEELLGPECSLLQQLMGSSLEKIETELGKVKVLGACYKELAKQIGSVDKSMAGLDQVIQAVKMEECAKLLLACQSGQVRSDSVGCQ